MDNDDCFISFEEDDFIREKIESEVRWVVHLDDGRAVYQDDGRPGHPLPAWLRLKAWLTKHSETAIIGMYLQFRSHIERMPPNAEGYYFTKAAAAVMYGDAYGCVVTGVLREAKVHAQWWRCPELIHEQFQVKELDEELVQLCLIRNPN